MVDSSLALEWMLSKGQQFINQMLLHAELDHSTPFVSLDQKRLRVKLSPIDTTFEILFFPSYLILSQETTLPVHLTLCGTPLQFLKTLAEKSPEDIDFQGDAKTAQALQTALNMLNVDIEGFLCAVFGNMVGRMIYLSSVSIKNKTKEVLETSVEDFSDYCQYEAQIAVSETEVQKFAQESFNLRHRVEALEKRIMRLKRKIGGLYVP